MNRVMQACVVSMSVFVSQAYAQDMGQMGDAPPQTETHTESVQMQMAPPGGPAMNLNMNVQVQHTSSSTHSASYTVPANSPPPQAAPLEEGRDCGTGKDPGCTMTRHGQLPMDAEEFRGFLQAMRTNDNELNREEIAKSTLESSHLTAKQLGMVLDLFENEINRYEVAQAAAPKVVNPKHALGLSSKFENSIYATDFTKLMTSQR